MNPQRPKVPEIFNINDMYQDLNWTNTEEMLSAVKWANKKFADWIEKQTVVYGEPSIIKPSICNWYLYQEPKATHTAYLVCPTELRPEKCAEHKPYFSDGSYWCSTCEKKLEVIGWKEVE